MAHHNTVRLGIFFLTISLLLVAPVHADPTEGSAEKGLQIATEQKKRDTGWGDSESKVLMILRDAGGDESIRRMRTLALEVIGDGDKSLIIFDEPRDVRGSAFLSHSHPTAEDDQWLFLPAIKRTRRIASRNKSGPFMASEFAYEDMASFELEKYQFRYLRDEEVNGVMCYVIERIPADKFSGYSKTIAWVDKAHYRVQKIEFYDKKQSLLKTLVATDYKLFKDKYWRPMLLRMQNHQTGKSTDLVIEELQFDVGRSAADFDVNVLDRLR
ncbi:MAG: outer membrane lipoprotein-sorting protein [Rheinheimera sp.]|uniref:outer membrane lipoprotein-sorting protein n=1 Tax=Arsukibacterium sp. UBA3155 TaxID=1946058 RepID=UPI000C8BCA85|nr:outer membrane lipoprotein-sorting protein [Arsukibacterium sp. UBA3155]MAD73498.1 outer membrane lipoprotein-sorting protein [Rheinheimera sp.]|tara:strand:+ start:36639 stop:37448 length:810 start_codon:yes stop_codon:yes gene_type:complete